MARTGIPGFIIGNTAEDVLRVVLGTGGLPYARHLFIASRVDHTPECHSRIPALRDPPTAADTPHSGLVEVAGGPT